MRFMHWSYRDLCECPAFYLEVLMDMIQKEQQDREFEELKAGRG